MKVTPPPTPPHNETRSISLRGSPSHVYYHRLVPKPGSNPDVTIGGKGKGRADANLLWDVASLMNMVRSNWLEGVPPQILGWAERKPGDESSCSAFWIFGLAQNLVECIDFSTVAGLTGEFECQCQPRAEELIQRCQTQQYHRSKWILRSGHAIYLHACYSGPLR
jgi:hypothetical protein